MSGFPYGQGSSTRSIHGLTLDLSDGVWRISLPGSITASRNPSATAELDVRQSQELRENNGTCCTQRPRTFTPPFPSCSRPSHFLIATPTGTWPSHGRTRYRPGTVRILPCELREFEHSWECIRRTDLHKLSAVDATSLTIMKRARIRLAFDRHFSVAGSRFVA